MSAIYGAINFMDEDISEKEKKILREAFKDCIIDDYKEYCDGPVFMGEGIQYFTKEDHFSTGPIEENERYFVADAMIDNRDELSDEKNCSDEKVLHDYYDKKGEAALNDLLGAFAFVAYDRTKKQLDIAIDTVSNRYVYYMIQEDTVYFSSLMTPLEKIKKTPELNIRWLADFMHQDYMGMFTEAEENPIKDIFRIAPAGFVRIGLKDSKPAVIKKYRYWDPVRDQKKVRFRSDEEYKAEFRRVYKQSVECLLRAENETACFLSGGFDSSSVATWASTILKERGKKLYTFTSVPLKAYKNDMGDNFFTDESEAVKKTAEFLGNLDCTFMDMPDVNVWQESKSYMQKIEMPYKSAENMLWLFEGCKLAKAKNANIILGAAFGNGTVSFENVKPYFATLFKSGHWIKLHKEINGISRRLHFSKKSIWETTVKDALGINKPFISPAFTQRGFIKTTVDEHASKEWFKAFIENGIKTETDWKRYQNSFFPVDTIRHYGEFDMKNSLYSGVIVRDPTKDKRLMEFCLGVPGDQFTHNGIRKRLLREYMKDMMPPHVIKEVRQGAQSADFKQRICAQEETIRDELLELYKDNYDNYLIDSEAAYNALNGRSFEEFGNFDLYRFIFTGITLRYMQEKSNSFDRIVE